MLNNARYNSIAIANLEKIIEQGIHHNLQKLNECSNAIVKYKMKGRLTELRRELTNGVQLIQHLESNLKQLHLFYHEIQHIDFDKKYTNIINSLNDEVTTRISLFKSENEEINFKLFDEKRTSTALANTDEKDCLNKIEITELLQEMAQTIDTKERLRQLDSLQSDISELNTLTVNVANLVGEQRELVDNITTNITEAENNIRDGTTTLIKTSGYYLTPITCAAAGGAIFGPVGAIVGLKLSTSVLSAFGASFASYSLAKLVQNKSKKKDLKEIENTRINSKTSM